MEQKNQIAKFYDLKKSVDEREALLADTTGLLEHDYDELVPICPHSQAVEVTSTIGNTRRCKICGITDYASEGGTPGDEYDYGYPGHPSKSFWAATDVETVDQEVFFAYGRHHEWVVKGGQPHKRGL